MVDFFHNLKCDTLPTSREIFQSLFILSFSLKKQLPSGISSITLIREHASSFRAIDYVLCGSSANYMYSSWMITTNCSSRFGLITCKIFSSNIRVFHLFKPSDEYETQFYKCSFDTGLLCL